MQNPLRLSLAAVTAVALGLPLLAQQPLQVPPTPPTTAPAAPPVVPTGNAATVNGQAIPEKALQRVLRTKGVKPERYELIRSENLNYLIDDVLVDQYLQKINVPVDPKEVDARIDKVRKELESEHQDFAKVLQSLMLTEAELREEVVADLRWEVFAGQRATEAALQDLFAKEPEFFNGSMVRARHILLSPAENDPQACQQAQQQLQQIKQEIDKKVADGLAKLPAGSDNLARERERMKLVDQAFADAARTSSVCPTKANGGDLPWFPRGGSMVEPFAKTAFALKPFEISDVVKTIYGYHLILVTDRRPGPETKFETVKDEVKELYLSRLHKEMVSRLRPVAAIVINPAPPLPARSGTDAAGKP